MEKRENIKMIEENNQIQDMLQKARENAEKEIQRLQSLKSEDNLFEFQ